jgi:hypothetical protein
MGAGMAKTAVVGAGAMVAVVVMELSGRKGGPVG